MNCHVVVLTCEFETNNMKKPTKAKQTNSFSTATTFNRTTAHAEKR